MSSVLKQRYLNKFSVGAVVLIVTAMSANAANIKDDKEVFSRLLITAIANEIRENCETIAAREIKATFYVLGIVSYAKRQGFSMDEIDTFRNDETQQNRLRAATYKYLDANGVDRSKKTGYCALGTVEMNNRTASGKLLKSR